MGAVYQAFRTVVEAAFVIERVHVILFRSALKQVQVYVFPNEYQSFHTMTIKKADLTSFPVDDNVHESPDYVSEALVRRFCHLSSIWRLLQ